MTCPVFDTGKGAVELHASIQTSQTSQDVFQSWTQSQGCHIFYHLIAHNSSFNLVNSSGKARPNWSVTSRTSTVERHRVLSDRWANVHLVEMTLHVSVRYAGIRAACSGHRERASKS